MNKDCRFFPRRPAATVTVISILWLLLGTHSALAQAQLIKSNPPDKAELKEPPARVELWFNEGLEDSSNSIEVIPAAELSDKNHANLARGKPTVDPADPTHLTIVMATLKPGKYVVQYRVVSRDRHTAPGQLTFALRQTKS